MTPSQFKKKMQQVKKHFEKAESILNSLPAGIQDEVHDYHNEDATLQHCTRWGIQGSGELYDDARRFIRKAKDNGSI